MRRTEAGAGVESAGVADEPPAFGGVGAGDRESSDAGPQPALSPPLEFVRGGGAVRGG